MEESQTKEEPSKNQEYNHPSKSNRFQEYTARSAWAIILIILGIYFLLSNFNIVSREFIAGIVRAWPALLVFWGIEIYTKDKPKIRTSANVILVMLVIFLILTYSNQYIPYFR